MVLWVEYGAVGGVESSNAISRNINFIASAMESG